MLLQQQTFTNQVSETAQKIISRAWEPQTKRKYKSILKNWAEICGEKSISTMQTDEINIIQFLTEEYDRDLSLCRYISALKNNLTSHILDANVVKKNLKSPFKLRPPKTYCHAIRGINIVLNFLQDMRADSDMDVSRKLVCLFMLLSGSRVKSISHSKITNMYLTDTECSFVFGDVLKHSKLSFKEKTLVFRAFPQNPKLCSVFSLIQYLDIRLSRSSDTALF